MPQFNEVITERITKSETNEHMSLAVGELAKIVASTFTVRVSGGVSGAATTAQTEAQDRIRARGKIGTSRSAPLILHQGTTQQCVRRHPGGTAPL